MNDDVKTWLKDIEQAILEINSFMPEVKNFKDFQKDLKTRRAVERNIEIIGEAMTRILKAEPALKFLTQGKLPTPEIELSTAMIPCQKIYCGELLSEICQSSIKK